MVPADALSVDAAKSAAAPIIQLRMFLLLDIKQ